MMSKEICRICLEANIRTHPIVNTALQHVFEKLSEQLCVAEGRPLSACYICYARLKTCHELMIKCHRSEEILKLILMGNQEDLHLAGQLSNFKTLVMSSVQRTSIGDETHVVVKEEPISEDKYSEESSLQLDLDSSQYQPIVNMPQTDKRLECDINVKHEIITDEYPDQEMTSVEDNDYSNTRNYTPQKSFQSIITVKQEVLDSEGTPDITESSIVNVKQESYVMRTDENDYMNFNWSQSHSGIGMSFQKGRNDLPDVEIKQERPLSQVQCGVLSVEVNDHSNINWPRSPSLKQFSSGAPDVSQQIVTDDDSSPSKIISVDKPFQCHICHSTFTRKGNLKQHVAIHSGQKPFKCLICHSTFTQKSALGKHSRMHTGIKPFKCNVCQRDFAHKNDLQKHTRIHTGERPYRCDLCESTFKEKDQLNIHNRIHTDERPFKCEICQKSFRQKQNFRRHNRIHTGERPYKCHICGSRFVQKGSLNNHLRMHSGAKPFKCETCHTSFSQKCHLKSHILVHTGEKPFKCDICQSSYKDKSSLVRHIRRHK